MPRTVTQRELRNESASVMDAIERGETVVVTRNGRPVAELKPAQSRQYVAAGEVLRTLRGLPKTSFTALRSEADALLGPDGIDD
jgi:prevent-host-death family protein